MMARLARAAIRTAIVAAAMGTAVHAHDGPPYPILPEQIVGSCAISVWADPDATDDGTAAGRFWTTIEPAGDATSVPADTRATISVWPIDGSGPVQTQAAVPTGTEVSPQFAVLVLDHEGRFGVRVAIDGPLGAAHVETEVEATYDQRPSPYMLVVYLVPFLLAGGLWVKLMMRRRSA